MLFDDHLGRSRFFRSLTPEARGALRAACIDVRHLPGGTHICHAGEPDPYLRLLLDGWAYRYKLLPDGRRAITAILIPGDPCNLDVVNNTTPDYDIMSATDCTMATITQAEFAALAQRYPSLGTMMTRMTMIENAILMRWNVTLGRMSAEERFAHLICELRVRLKLAGLGQGDTYLLPLSQAELADTLGLSLVHVNRVIQRMRGQRLIDFYKRRISLLDWQTLTELAQFDDAYLTTDSEKTRPPLTPMHSNWVLY